MAATKLHRAAKASHLMAGRGPAPAENRRRANVPARGDWVDLAPLEQRVLPELPESPPLIVKAKAGARNSSAPELLVFPPGGAP
jgi:hypothetical protein